MTQWQPSSLEARQEFWVTTGKLVTATNANLLVGGLSLFNPPGSGKVLEVHDLQIICQNQSIAPINKITADAALGFTLTPQNMILSSGATSVAIVNSSPSGIAASVTQAGTLFIETNYASQTLQEILTNGEIIELQPGNGIAIYPFITTIGNYFCVNAGWTERPQLPGGF